MGEPSSVIRRRRDAAAGAAARFGAAFIAQSGDWQEIEGYPGRLRSYDDNSLFILHRTPFQPPPVSEAAAAAGVTEQQQMAAARGYGLDIWRNKKKVLSLIWDAEESELGVVMFKPGAWEDDLARLVRGREAASGALELPQWRRIRQCLGDHLAQKG